MQNNYELLVDKEQTERLDKYISKTLDLPRSQVEKHIALGSVLVNGASVNKKYVPKMGDKITIHFPEEDSNEILPENIPLSIVYEDEELLVVDKPQGMVVHPATSHASGTLVNALLYHCGSHLSTCNEDDRRPGILHRIDKETSGLLLVAKTNSAHEMLAEQIRDHSLGRYYMALCHGGFSEDDFCIDKPIGRHPKDRKKMAIVPGGREGITHVHVVERFGAYTLVRCKLETGRTHQIRVHLSSMGHPVVGDKVYGVRKEEFSSLEGQLLHACLLGFIHPVSQEYCEFTSPLPSYYQHVLHVLRSRRGVQ